MARQLKNFLKAKKRGRCKCLTLNMWRCGEFCWCVNECGDVTPTPVPPTPPEITYSLSKVEDTKLINYTSTKLEDGVETESYRLHLVYDDNDDLESASITDWETDKPITTLQDAIDLAAEAESAITLATQVAYEWVFTTFEEFYNSL